MPDMCKKYGHNMTKLENLSLPNVHELISSVVNIIIVLYTQALLGLSTARMPLHSGVWFGLCKQTTYQLVKRSNA